MQLITYYQRAFKKENVDVWLLTYKILSTSKSTGVIQLIPNATSLDGLKKKEGYPGSLRSYFLKTYGGPSESTEEPSFKTAIKNYISSMAGYSIVAYCLSIKDR